MYEFLKDFTDSGAGRTPALVQKTAFQFTGSLSNYSRILASGSLHIPISL